MWLVETLAMYSHPHILYSTPTPAHENVHKKSFYGSECPIWKNEIDSDDPIERMIVHIKFVNIGHFLLEEFAHIHIYKHITSLPCTIETYVP